MHRRSVSPVRPVRPTFLPTVLVVGLTTALVLGLGAFTAPAGAQRYTPSAGVTTNNPLGDLGARRAILGKLIRTIDATPKRQTIRVASWNVRSDAFIDALIRAHRRHVTVRLILSRGNADADNPNEGVQRLRRAFEHRNKRRPENRSRIQKCVSSCRGPSGIAHSKFFLFSKAGRARDVVINGSANATDLAAGNQWNDVFTVRDRPGVYAAFRKVFGQMWQDRKVKQGYRADDFGSLRTMFYPYTGKHTQQDPVLKELARTRCDGARNGGHGHTRIRIAQTSWFGDRGKEIAQRVRTMKNRGCDVKVLYAVAGNEVLRILRRGGPKPVPMRHIVQDFNDDGVYDRYLHTKVMTIRGVYGDKRRAWVTFNGSANWSPAVLASDEAVMRIRGKGVVQRYNRWFDRIFAHPPDRHPNSKGDTPSARRGASGDVDPYALIQPN